MIVELNDDTLIIARHYGSQPVLLVLYLSPLGKDA